MKIWIACSACWAAGRARRCPHHRGKFRDDRTDEDFTGDDWTDTDTEETRDD